jgi:phage gpG-like protein
MIKVTGADQVIQKFQNTLDLTKNMAPFFLKALGDKGPTAEPWTIKGSLSFGFQNEQSPDGKSWDDLNPDYKTWKDKHFSPDLPILMLTGRLFESIVYGDTADTVQIIEPQKLTYGTTLPYAAALHYGMPSKGLPARPFMGFRDGQLEMISLEFRKYLTEVYRAEAS